MTREPERIASAMAELRRWSDALPEYDVAVGAAEHDARVRDGVRAPELGPPASSRSTWWIAAGAAAILLEAVPPDVSQRVVERTEIPVIGCGAGPACHGAVVVTQDAIGLAVHRPPRFVPKLGDAASVLKEMFAKDVNQLESGAYPAPEHQYEMPADERAKFAGKK